VIFVIKESISDEFTKSQKPKKCHAELDSASHKIKDLPDPETRVTNWDFLRDYFFYKYILWSEGGQK